MNPGWIQHVVLLGTLLGAGYASTAGSWCYEDPHCGPATWAALGQCNGTRQSPIDIVSAAAVHGPHLGGVSLAGYGDARKLLAMKNLGKTVEVELGDGLHLSAAGLPAVYTAKAFHLHWGQGAAKPGSEHLVDGKRFSMELHIVHTKNNLSLAEARRDPVGIAVLAFFLQATKHARPSPAWDSFAQLLKKVDLENTTAELDGAFSLRALLGAAELARYYRYPGSLTTPTCEEAVLWTVFPDALPVPPGVVAAFPATLRATNSSSGPPLKNNYRPPQRLGGRQVYLSAALHAPHGASPAPGPAPLLALLLSAAAIARHL